MYPISRLPDGFGNIFNAHFWRMQDFQSALFVGTNDWSYRFQLNPLFGPLTKAQWGYDLWGSCDGQYWGPITQTAFGDGQYNFGARTIVSTPDGRTAYLGSANQAQGTNVWQFSNTTSSLPACLSNPAGPAVSTAVARAITPGLAAAQPTSPTPTGLEADAQSCAAILSWAPAQGAAQYRVLRTDYVPADMSVSRPPQLAPAQVPDQPWLGGGDVVASHGTAWISTTATQIGTTTQPYFVDRSARQGVPATYTVEAVNAQGAVSSPSNVAYAPAPAPVVSFTSVTRDMLTAVTQRKVQSGASSLFVLLTTAQHAAARGDQAGAVQALNQLQQQLTLNPGQAIDPSTAQGLSVSVSELARQVSLARVSCDRGASIGVRIGN
jgi:hypothetical protein